MWEQALRVLDDASRTCPAVPIGEHEIERLPLEQRERLVAVFDGGDVVALVEVVGDELATRTLDLDEQQRPMRSSLWPPWPRWASAWGAQLLAPRQSAPDPEAQVLDVSDGLLNVVVSADVERLTAESYDV